MERLPHLGEQGAAGLLLRGMDRKDTGPAIKKQVMSITKRLGKRWDSCSAISIS